MPITADKAADIAKRHGLNLADAQALSVLADNEEHAGTLAAKFSQQPNDDHRGVDRLRAAEYSGDEKRNRRRAAAFTPDPQMERLAALSDAGQKITRSQRMSLGYYQSAKRSHEALDDQGDAK